MSAGAGQLRVVVADDQALIRQGFRMILTAQPDIVVVGEAADGAAAVDLTNELHPDVVLMDIRMPGVDGIEATRRIRGARVLMLTTFSHDEYVVESLRAGASGFLLKDSTPEELVHAVRVIAAGDSLLSPSVTTRLIARALPVLVSEGQSQAVPASLTEREVEVLKLIAKGHSNAEIAAALFVSDTTVKSHVSHLLAKMGLRDRVQAVVAAYELGLVAPGTAGQGGGRP